MNSTWNEIWVKPDNGPLTVTERGFNGELGFADPDEAIRVATQKAKLYPNITFVVRQQDATWTGNGNPRIIFTTNH